MPYLSLFKHNPKVNVHNLTSSLMNQDIAAVTVTDTENVTNYAVHSN
jgi:hypothetical protein